MNRNTLLIASIIACAVAQNCSAQSQPQTVAVSRVDIQSLATGYRASKIIGANVVNSNDETIGKVDDLIVTSSAKTPVAILSVGGFLGVGSKNVAVSTSDLTVTPEKITMPGGTKESLKALPEFDYK